MKFNPDRDGFDKLNTYMIKDILIDKRKLHFKELFQIAYERVTDADVIIIKIIDMAGNYGLGSAAPDKEVTGETVDSAFLLLQKKLTKNFFSLSVSHRYAYHEKIQKEFNGFPSVQSAVEEAILNLFAKQKNVSLTNLFGGCREHCNVTITIGIKTIKETVQEAKQRIREGYKTIKIKCGGGNFQDDVEKTERLTKILSSGCQLAVDVNQGHSLSEAVRFLQKIKNKKIAFIEQPIAARNIKGLKRLHKISEIPIIADEAAVSFEDVINLVKNDCVDGVNIKLMKCGGPVNFLKIFHFLRSLKKITMIGCMYESQISVTTGAHLALALPIDYVDLDSGHLDFPDEPAKGGVIIQNGRIESIDPLELI